MKRILISISIAVLLLSSCGFSTEITSENRTLNNFTVSNGNVTWSYIYQYESSYNERVKNWVLDNFNIKRNDGDHLVCSTNKMTLPYEEAGYSYMNILLLFRHPCTIYFTADFKDGKFRVIVDNIIWEPQVGVTTYSGRVGLSQGAGTMDLHDVAFKGSGYNNAFVNYSSAQLNDILTYYFRPKLSKQKYNDNW